MSLATLLELHLALEEARERRSRNMHLTALFSVPISIVVIWPQLLSEIGRRAVLTFWAFSALATLVSLLSEGRLRLRAMRATQGTS